MKALMTVFFVLCLFVAYSQVAQREPIIGHLPAHRNTSGQCNVAIRYNAQQYHPSYNILIGYGGNIYDFGKCNVMIGDNLQTPLVSDSHNWQVDYNCEYLRNRPVLAMQILAYEKVIKNTPHYLWPNVIIDLQQAIKNLHI